MSVLRLVVALVFLLLGTAIGWALIGTATGWAAPSLCAQLQIGGECRDDLVPDLLIQRTTNKRLNIDTLYFNLNGNARKQVESLLTKGFVALGRSDRAPWSVQPPLNWAANPFQDKNWQFQVSAWRMVEPFLRLFEVTRDPSHLEYPLNLIEDWYDFHVVRKEKNSMIWHDMAAGLRSLRLAYLIDRYRHQDFSLSPNRLATLVHLASIHAERLRDPKFITPNNHGVFQLHGLAALCRALPELNVCDSADSYLDKEFTTVINTQYNSEGMHLEHSPGYHVFMRRVFSQVMKSGWYDHLIFGKEVFRTVVENEYWMTRPDGRLVMIGDTSRGAGIVKPTTQTLPPVCRMMTTFDKACYEHRAFSGVGYGVVRSLGSMPPKAGSMLFLQAAFHSRTHKHADDLSFEWYDRGLMLLSDSGKYSYDFEAPGRAYVISTRAHNTVEIDGQNFSTETRNAYGSGLRRVEERPWGFVLEGEVTHHALGVQHHRTLFYRPREWLVVFDRLKTGRFVQAVQWFHYDEALVPEVAGKGRLRLPIPDGSLLSMVQVGSAPNCTQSFVRGQKEPVMQGWISLEYGQLTERTAVGFACSGTDPSFVTVFAFDRADAAPPEISVKGLGSDAARVSIATSTGHYTLDLAHP